MKICSLLQIFLSLILGRGFRTLSLLGGSAFRQVQEFQGGEKLVFQSLQFKTLCHSVSLHQRLAGLPASPLSLFQSFCEMQSDHFRMQIRLSPRRRPHSVPAGQIPQLQGHRHQSLTNGALIPALCPAPVRPRPLSLELPPDWHHMPLINPFPRTPPSPLGHAANPVPGRPLCGHSPRDQLSEPRRPSSQQHCAQRLQTGLGPQAWVKVSVQCVCSRQKPEQDLARGGHLEAFCYE